MDNKSFNSEDEKQLKSICRSIFVIIEENQLTVKQADYVFEQVKDKILELATL